MVFLCHWNRVSRRQGDGRLFIGRLLRIRVLTVSWLQIHQVVNLKITQTTLSIFKFHAISLFLYFLLAHFIYSVPVLSNFTFDVHGIKFLLSWVLQIYRSSFGLSRHHGRFLLATVTLLLNAELLRRDVVHQLHMGDVGLWGVRYFICLFMIRTTWNQWNILWPLTPLLSTRTPQLNGWLEREFLLAGLPRGDFTLRFGGLLVLKQREVRVEGTDCSLVGKAWLLIDIAGTYFTNSVMRQVLRSIFVLRRVIVCFLYLLSA